MTYGVPKREYLYPPNPYHQKFEQKALFSSRLAGVNAQTPQHAKMKILADITKHACNRFNINPKDLFDDLDLCAQSKSSSRAPAKGDEKEDENALDTTKRCGNTLSLYETRTSCKKEKSVRISARRDVKSRKGVQGGARGRK